MEPVGSTKSIRINVRVIAATNRDLYQMARNNQFREDLIYRLNVINIQIPPLRKRKEDIPLLAQALLEKSSRELGKPAPQISAEFMELLQQQDWPGNVRELGNTMMHALLHCRSQTLTPDLLTPQADIPVGHIDETTSDQAFLTLEELEAQHIQKVLTHTRGHKSNSCKILGISRPALDRKIEKYGLSLS